MIGREVIQRIVVCSGLVGQRRTAILLLEKRISPFYENRSSDPTWADFPSWSKPNQVVPSSPPSVSSRPPGAPTEVLLLLLSPSSSSSGSSGSSIRRRRSRDATIIKVEIQPAERHHRADVNSQDELTRVAGKKATKGMKRH